MTAFESSGDRERKVAIAADPLAQVIHDTINAKAHASRLYPDLYAIEVADAVRAYLGATEAIEWEHAVRTRKGRILFTATAGAVEGDVAIRRRPAGPWIEETA